MSPAFDYYKMNQDIRILFHDLGYNYWIDENTNYPAGQGNCFLCQAIRLTEYNCIGGVGGRNAIYDGDTIVGYKKWTATLYHDWHEETDSDCEVVYEGESRDEALKALWENRLKYSF